MDLAVLSQCRFRTVLLNAGHQAVDTEFYRFGSDPTGNRIKFFVSVVADDLSLLKSRAAEALGFYFKLLKECIVSLSCL